MALAAEKRPGAQSTNQRGIARGLTLLTIRREGEMRLAVKTGRGILDVPQAARLLNMHAPSTMDDLLQQEDGPSLNALVDAVANTSSVQAANKSKVETVSEANNLDAAWLKEDEIEFGPLVSRPEKIVCVGLNYRHHAQEIGAPIPKQPVLFSKYNNTLSAHNGRLKLPVHVASKFDYEVELVIVMGRRAYNVSEAEALKYVAGYAAGNDFSARDLQLETGGQWMIGKTPDGFAPLGPYMVTADQIDPDKLKVECRVNGETRQQSTTADFIFNTAQMVSYISKFITLQPGDIIFTGTPEGVILGKPKDQQVWLKAGDKIACSVEKLGELKFELV